MSNIVKVFVKNGQMVTYLNLPRSFMMLEVVIFNFQGLVCNGENLKRFLKMNLKFNYYFHLNSSDECNDSLKKLVLRLCMFWHIM